MIRVYEGVNDYYLYHSTPAINAIRIITDNKLMAIRADDEKAISFSRNKRVIYGDIAFTIDRRKLSHNYKIIPVSKGLEQGYRSDGDAEVSDEERVLRDVKNFLSYVLSIDFCAAKTPERIIRKALFTSSIEEITTITDNSNNNKRCNNFYNLYLVVNAKGIPVGKKLSSLFKVLEDKLNDTGSDEEWVTANTSYGKYNSPYVPAKRNKGKPIPNTYGGGEDI